MLGKCKSRDIEPMLVRNHNIEWVNEMEYLGTHTIGGNKMSFDI